MNIDRPVFVSIETSAFSGATLLAFLLGAHPQIATVGEMNGLIASEDPDTYRCSCGEKIKICQFWQSVKVAMHGRGFEFDVAQFNMRFVSGGSAATRYLRAGSSRHHRLDAIRDAILYAWPSEKRRLRALANRNVAFIESVLGLTGKEVFVDTSKDRLRLKALRRFSTLDVRAVHLVRDVRGVVASQLRRGTAKSARQAAHEWVRLNRKLEANLQTLPKEKRMWLRYEDLCYDALGTLERLYGFCGVDTRVRRSDIGAAPHHIVGNPMRLKPLSGIRLDERWKSQLTQMQLAEIEQVAGILAPRYGYL